MAVGLFEPWQVPLGYFLTKGGLTAERLFNCGVCARALVFDGTAANIATAENLAAKMPDKPYFTYLLFPDSNVHIILDNCHMIKLARNAFAKDALVDKSGNKLSWIYIERLFQMQQN